MNIGNIVSTVQSEPLTIGEFEEVLEDLDLPVVTLPSYEVLVNEEITPEIKEDLFA